MDQLTYAHIESLCSMEFEEFAVPLPQDTFMDDSPLQLQLQLHVDLPPVSRVVTSVLDALSKDQTCWRMPGGTATQPVEGLSTPPHLVSLPAGCMDLFWTQAFIPAKELLTMSTARNFRYIGGNGSRGTGDNDKVWPSTACW